MQCLMLLGCLWHDGLMRARILIATVLRYLRLPCLIIICLETNSSFDDDLNLVFYLVYRNSSCIFHTRIFSFSFIFVGEQFPGYSGH